MLGFVNPSPPVNARPFVAELKTEAGLLKPEPLVNARPFDAELDAVRRDAEPRAVGERQAVRRGVEPPASRGAEPRAVGERQAVLDAIAPFDGLLNPRPPVNARPLVAPTRCSAGSSTGGRTGRWWSRRLFTLLWRPASRGMLRWMKWLMTPAFAEMLPTAAEVPNTEGLVLLLVAVREELVDPRIGERATLVVSPRNRSSLVEVTLPDLGGAGVDAQAPKRTAENWPTR